MPGVGDVCEIYFYEAAPKKFAICVDAEDRQFLLINRECYNERTDIPVDADEIEWLSQPSYVETGEAHYVYGADDIRRIDGQITPRLRDEICDAIEEHGVMPPLQMNSIVANLRALDD